MDVDRMRQVVVSAAREAGANRRVVWSRPFAVSAVALTVFCIGALTSLQRAVREANQPVATKAVAAPNSISGNDLDPEGERQQLQFATPGGTRIIWVFDSQFEVKGTLP
jgi:hypothetical protein